MEEYGRPVFLWGREGNDALKGSCRSSTAHVLKLMQATDAFSEFGGHAMSEPGSGSDALSLTTTATETAAGYALNGSKTFVTNGPDSDLFVVFAATDRSLGFAGLSGFLLERGTPGLVVGARSSSRREAPITTV